MSNLRDRRSLQQVRLDFMNNLPPMTSARTNALWSASQDALVSAQARDIDAATFLRTLQALYEADTAGQPPNRPQTARDQMAFEFAKISISTSKFRYSPEELATWAYTLADALLAARETKA
jgi:hypothetical protein